MRSAAALVCLLLVFGACADDEKPPPNVGPDAAVDQEDSCDLLTKADAERAIGKVKETEGFESGIGPGCTYRNGEQKIGMNLYTGTYTKEAWFQEVVSPILNTTQGAKNSEMGGVGDAATWISSDSVHRLIVLADGTAFDLFVQLGKSASDDELRKAAALAARAIIKRLPPAS